MLADGAASYCVHTDVITEHLARDLVPSGAIIRGTRDTRTVLAVSWGCLCIYICYLLSVTACAFEGPLRDFRGTSNYANEKSEYGVYMLLLLLIHDYIEHGRGRQRRYHWYIYRD